MINKINESSGKCDRPYERCMRFGPEALSDPELLAVIIRTGTKGLSATELAEKILEGSVQKHKLLGICHKDIHELMRIPGIGRVKAVQIKCIGELSKRIAAYEASRNLSFSDPGTISEYYMERLRHEEQELLICMMLDVRNRMISDKVMSRGTVNAALISPREIFIEALRAGAVNIILLHNHPSGEPEPSPEDADITEAVREAGELIGIGLLDHIIIGDRNYYSFRQEEML